MLRITHNTKQGSIKKLKLITPFSCILLLSAILFSTYSTLALNGETKEFDWSEYGASLTNPKSAYTSPGNNLRILVSPQRRMIKHYESDFVNGSSPSAVQSEASYVIPTGSQPYVSPSAYSALSASLANLKSRLNSRGVALADTSSQAAIYSSSAVPGYGSGLLSDSQRSNPALQPTYLSVTNQQEQPPQVTYTSSQGASNDNKTIVLAIPAKINFLTDSSKQAQQQQQVSAQVQQPQQLTVIQAGSPDRSSRPDYGKTLSLINGHEAEAAVRDPNTDQEHQYVIVDSHGSVSNEHGQLVAAQAPTSSMYSNMYSPASLKYVPAPPGPAYEPEHFVGVAGGCLETCNSADSRWRKYSISKYKSCCFRSAQYDPLFELPVPEKLSDSVKQADESYYNYLFRKSRPRRSRKSTRYFNRYPSRWSSSPSSSISDEGSSSGDNSDTVIPLRHSSSRYQHQESPYMRYYRGRGQVHESGDSSESSGYSGVPGKKSGSKERSFRRGRAKELESTGEYSTSQDNPSDDEESGRSPAQNYGSGDFAVGEVGRGYGSERRPSVGFGGDEEDGSRTGYEDSSAEMDSSRSGPGLDGSDYVGDSEVSGQEESGESEAHKYGPRRARKRQHSKNGRSRKNGKANGKRSRQSLKNLHKQDGSSNHNATDFESTQNDDAHYRPESNNDEDQSHHRDTTGSENSDTDREAVMLLNKYKSQLNDSTMINLSKTTMHLKEILSMLEKKAQLKLNESVNSNPASSSFISTSTPAPTTIPSLFANPLLGPSFGNPSLTGVLSSDYLTSELNLKSPYRDLSSFSSSLALPPVYGSPTLDSFSSMASFGSPSHYNLGAPKHLALAGLNQPRKRRVPKNMRYNHVMMPKQPHVLGGSASLIHPTSQHSKNPLLSPAYYHSLQYPLWYPRSNGQSITNPYPYKTASKSPYTSLLNGSMQSKLAAAASGTLYNDDSRFHGLGNGEPMSNVASSIRPSAVRLRSKPFVFQPHVLPIYSRHTILTQPMDVKK